MNRIKKYLTSVLALTLLSTAAFTAVVPHNAFAAVSAKEEVCKSIGGTTKEDNCSTGTTTVGQVIDFAVNLLSIVVGVAAVIMIIIGGFKYVTSNGDSNGVASAKNTIIYAIVGLIVAALAQVIARFVLTSV